MTVNNFHKLILYLKLTEIFMANDVLCIYLLQEIWQ